MLEVFTIPLENFQLNRKVNIENIASVSLLRKISGAGKYVFQRGTSLTSQAEQRETIPYFDVSLTLQVEIVLRKYDCTADDIRDFLRESPELLGVLMEAPKQIEMYFGEAELGLKMSYDPEDGSKELFLVLRSAYSPEDAVERENRMIEEWFIGTLERTNGKLGLTEEPM